MFCGDRREERGEEREWGEREGPGEGRARVGGLSAAAAAAARQATSERPEESQQATAAAIGGLKSKECERRVNEC